ncbi:MAG: hypothetical protein ACI4TF_01620 [Oliverpabstia sp.]
MLACNFVYALVTTTGMSSKIEKKAQYAGKYVEKRGKKNGVRC